MKYTITNETLKSRAQKIQQEFENGGASWEGLALEIARLELSLEAIKKDGLRVRRLELILALGTGITALVKKTSHIMTLNVATTITRVLVLVAWVIVMIAKMREISK
jgi:hypothetical protein